MVRLYWISIIKKAWEEKSVVWLTGVRRSGKTTLCNDLTPNGYYDCELPRVRRLLEDPEQFFKELEVDQITLDEIHRLDNPSEVLKIAADYFKKVKVIATGSSTLSAGDKFKDTLTDRKRNVFLTPIGLSDMHDFKNNNLKHRLLHGGLPPFFLSKTFPERSYQDWIDSFWAKDIEELFNLEKKSAFMKMFELLCLQSGGLFEAKGLATACGVSHTTIASYLNVMEQTHIAYVLRPYHKNAAKEIIAAPKVYFFDSGFMSFFKGTTDIHKNDLGIYWEHFVLNELLTFINREHIHIWRDKQKNEVDFVIKLRGQDPVAIECKWKASEFDSKGISKFRDLHPKGINLLIASDLESLRIKKHKELTVIHCPLHLLRRELSAK